MTFSDDDRPRKPLSAVPGENLTDLSIEELTARVALYQREIDRLNGEIEAKQKSRAAADSFFRR